jgi:hypothetical protein
MSHQRPNRRRKRKTQRERDLEAWGADIMRRDIREALMGPKRDWPTADEREDQLAADRRQRQTYPGNQYLITGGAVGVLIIIIAIAIAAGWITN